MASLFMRFPQGRAKAFTLSYDDGLESDVRLVDMLRARGMKGTFNVGSRMVAPEGHVYPPDAAFRHLTRSRRAHAYDGMEVAVHGSTHPWLERLPAAVCTAEVLGDRLALEEEFGCLIQGMAYPYGAFSENVLQVLRVCGIRHARTTRSTGGFALPADWLLLDPTCHHGDPALPALCRRFVQRHPEEDCDRGPWLFCVWGHTYELEETGDWPQLEGLLDAVAGRKDVWYATLGEIREYAAAFEALAFSADGRLVYNPSACTVWLDYDGRPYSVASGQTRRLQP